MRRFIISMAFLVLIGGPAAIAQSGGSGGSSTAVKNSSGPQAPVGHRQPRADQLPSEKNLSDPNSAMNQQDVVLNRKIKSICRGC